MSHRGFGNPPERRRRLADIHQVMESLRSDVPAPDLTAAILARVQDERPFTDRRTRRFMTVGRIGVAASLAVLALGVSLVCRFAPGAAGWAAAPQPRPLSNVVDIAETNAATGYQALLTTYEAVSEPVGIVTARLHPTLAGGKPCTTAAGAEVCVVPINRLGKMTYVCTVPSPRTTAGPVPQTSSLSPTSGPSTPAAVATVYCLRPILSKPAYDRVLMCAERLAPAPRDPARLRADDSLPPLIGGPGDPLVAR